MASQLSAKLSLDVSGYKQGVDEAKRATEGYKTQLGDLSKKFPSMRKELGQTRRAIMDMESAWRAMSDEQKRSFEGQQLQKQLSSLKQRGADLVDTFGDIGVELRNMASDTFALDVAKQGFDVLGNSISLVANAYATFTGDSEDAKRALTIFAGVQSTVNTLTALQNALQKQSSLMLAITTAQQKLKTKAMELDTAATGKNIVATKSATAAQWALNLAADANPYVLLASAIAALVAGYIIYKDEINELLGVQTKEENEIKELNDEFKNQSKTLADTKAKVTSLQIEWKNLKTEGEKKQWIEDNQDAFNSLGVEINTVKDAENLFVKNTAAFLKAQELRAKALAYTAVAASKYQKAIEAKEEVDETDIAWYEGAFTQLKQFAQGKYVQTFEQIKYSKAKALNDSSIELEEQAAEYLQKANKLNQEESKTLKQAEIKTTNKNNNKNKTSKTPKSSSKGGTTNEPIQQEIQQLENDLTEEFKNNPIEITIDYSQAQIEDKINELQIKLKNTPLTIDGVFNPEVDKIQSQIESWQEKLKPKKSIIDEEEFTKSISSGLSYAKEAMEEWDQSQDELREKRLSDLDTVGSAVQNVGSIFKSLGDMADDKNLAIMGIIGQAIANIALSYAQAMRNHKSFTIWDWIAAAASGLATMTAVITSIKQQTSGYATGGVVGGNSYNGDKLLVRVNSKERILTAKQNKAMNNAFEQIDSLATTGGKLYGTVTVKGSDLNIAMRNYDKTINKSR